MLFLSPPEEILATLAFPQGRGEAFSLPICFYVAVWM